MSRIERELEARFAGKLRRAVCSIDMGGGDAPAPDPAVGRAAEANAEIGKEALAFSKEQYGDLKALRARYQPMVDQILQQQIDIGNKNAAQADDYINYMKSTFRPIEQGLASEAATFDTEAKRDELAGKAASDVEQAAAVSDEAARRDAARFGVNPTDGAFAEQLAGTSLNKTILKVGAMNQARGAARAEGRALKFDVAGLGRGLPGAGQTASTVALNAGNSAVGVSNNAGANARADAGTMLQGYGTAAGAHNAAGNLGTNVFDARMRGYQADAQREAGMWGGLGTMAGMGAYAMLSTKSAKTKIAAVSPEKAAAKIKTLPVDKWTYKKGAGDEGTHIGTYAEDFKEAFGVGDGKTINVIDAIGVTMAAVKGLAQKVERIEGSGARAARMGVTS